jgi:hypothetical protein
MMKLSEIPDHVLANMVRGGIYTKGESLTDGEGFVLVLAVHYGSVDDISDPRDAFESFRALLADDDWEDRNIQVLTVKDGAPQVQETSFEGLEEEGE